jgi:diacylglycerol kinase family enzyme
VAGSVLLPVCNGTRIIMKAVITQLALLGNQFRVLPDAVNDDGCFEAFTISAQAKFMNVLSVIYRVLRGTHLNSEHVYYLKCSKLVVKMDRPLRFFGDGEISDLTEKLEIEIIPRVLKVIVPENWRDCDEV